jgi:hypothetical protein
MKLPCPVCRTRVRSDKINCPKCGEPLTDYWESLGRQSRNRFQNKLGFGLAIFLIISFLAFLALNIRRMSPAEVAERNRNENCSNEGKWAAQSASEISVSKKLRSPSTAKFPVTESHVIWDGGCNFSVTGKVDAQNVFGAVLRRTYSAQAMYSPEIESWSVTSKLNE